MKLIRNNTRALLYQHWSNVSSQKKGKCIQPEKRANVSSQKKGKCIQPEKGQMYPARKRANVSSQN